MCHVKIFILFYPDACLEFSVIFDSRSYQFMNLLHYQPFMDWLLFLVRRSQYRPYFIIIILFFLWGLWLYRFPNLQLIMLLPRPRRGLRGIVFTLSVCLCVYVCVGPISLYFISRLLAEISTFIGQRSRSQRRYIAFWMYSHIAQLRHWIFFLRHLLGYSIRWNNKNLSEQRNDVTKIYVNIWL